MLFDRKELDYFAVVAPFYTVYARDTTKEERRQSVAHIPSSVEGGVRDSSVF